MKLFFTFLLALLLAVTAVAEEQPVAEEWFVSLTAAYLDPPSDFMMGSTVEPAVGVGYAFNDDLAIELQWIPWQASGTDADSVWVTGLVDLDSPYAGIDPYVAIGLGSAKLDSNTVSSREEQAFVGLGFFADLGNRWGLRADVRAVSTGGEAHGFAQVGVTRSIGRASARPRDDDRDGVLNRDDACPETPAGRGVDSRGCVIPPPDRDGDGVVDGDDRCPSTPAGVAVDARGFEIDSDADGVVDRLDRCPGTPRGARVDSRGCEEPAEPAVTELNVEFDVDSARIPAGADDDFRRVFRFLERHPDARAAVEGHTDSTGGASYNQGLSERRAQAVADRLIEGAGLSTDRVEVVGRGESRPIATNDTPEGRQRNRRATAVISEEKD